MKPKNCPKCDGDDITVDSSGALQLSEISCGDCDYKIQAKVCEDSLVQKWNKIPRSVIAQESVNAERKEGGE